MEEELKKKKLRGKKARLQKIIESGTAERSISFAKRSIIYASIIWACLIAVGLIFLGITKTYEGLELALMLILFLPIVVIVFLAIDILFTIFSSVNLKYQFKLNKRWPAWLALGMLIAVQLVVIIFAIILVV